VSADVDEDFANGAAFDRGVGVGGLLEREAVQRQAGLLSDRQCTVGGSGRDTRDGMVLRCGWNRVDEDELVANVAVHQLAGRQLELVAAIRGVGGDRAARRQHGGVESGVGRGRDLDDDVDALGGDAPDLVGLW